VREHLLPAQLGLVATALRFVRYRTPEDESLGTLSLFGSLRLAGSPRRDVPLQQWLPQCPHVAEGKKIINRKPPSFRGRDRVRSIADSPVDRFDLLHRRAHTGVECDALCAKNKFVQTFADAPIRPLSPSTRSHQQNGHRRFPSFDRYESTLRFETRQQAVHLHNRLRHAAGARPSNDVSRTETGSPELRERRTATNRNSLALISLLASEWLNY